MILLRFDRYHPCQSFQLLSMGRDLCGLARHYLYCLCSLGMGNLDRCLLVCIGSVVSTMDDSTKAAIVIETITQARNVHISLYTAAGSD